jgi:ATP-dependent Clp protease protease subunit
MIHGGGTKSAGEVTELAASGAGDNSAKTNEVYATFAGPIDQSSIQRIFQGLAGAMTTGVTHVHLLFQSLGGAVSDGICLYNYFRAVPIDLTLYNVGGVSSIATIAFLGAKKRKTSAYATFMIHRTQSPAQSATSERLNAIAHSVVADDERTEAILRQHLKLSKDQWAVHKNADLWLTAKEAINCGLAEGGEFAPPPRTPIFNV